MNDSDVIGEGTYGCIHKPSLECKGRKKIDYTNKVSKVFDRAHAESELKEYNDVSKIDPTSKYYMGVPLKCQLKKTQKNKTSIDKCENSKLKRAFEKNISSLSLLVMMDGGVNLKEFAKHNTDSGSNSELELFWIELQRMFYGLRIFQKHNILHYDLKPQNMVYNEKTHRINFIDFGHMRTFKKAKSDSSKSKNHLSVFHWSYPFESYFLNKVNYTYFADYSDQEKIGFYQTVLQKTKEQMRVSGGEGTRNKEGSIKKVIVNFEEVADEIVGFFDYITSSMDELHRTQITKQYMEDFYNLLNYSIVPGGYNDFVKKSLRTIDSYGLGFSMLYVLHHVGPIMENQDFVKHVNELGYKMTTPDLRKRIELEDALREYVEILNNSGFLVKHNVGDSYSILSSEPECPTGKTYNVTKRKCVKT
jgi:serine/threonine protein kinase